MTPNDDTSSFTPLYNGSPVVVRFLSGDEVLAVVYQAPDDDRLLLARPISIHYQSTAPSALTTTPSPASVRYVRANFEQWVPFSDVEYFPVYLSSLLTIAPLSSRFAATYYEWSETLYQQVENSSSAPMDETTDPLTIIEPHATPSPNLNDEDGPEQIRNSYFDFVLHNFKQKGKPH